MSIYVKAAMRLTILFALIVVVLVLVQPTPAAAATLCMTQCSIDYQACVAKCMGAPHGCTEICSENYFDCNQCCLTGNC